MKTVIFNTVLFLALSLLTVGCNSQKKAIKELKQIKIEHPELFKADTSYIVRQRLLKFPIKEKELKATDVAIVDTFQVSNKHLDITIVRDGELFDVMAKTKPKTIRHYVTDTVVEIKSETIIDTVVEYRTPIIMKILALLWLVLIGYVGYKMSINGFQYYK